MNFRSIVGFCLLGCAALLGGAWQVSGATNSGPVIPGFVLPDQFGQSRKCEFGSGLAPLVLTVADKSGSEQVAGWVQGVKDRSGARVRLEGVADLTSVPAWLRPVVRGRFKARYHQYPVMLDWEGAVVRQFKLFPNEANVFLLDGRGRLIASSHGPADNGKLRELNNKLEHVLGGPAAGG